MLARMIIQTCRMKVCILYKVVLMEIQHSKGFGPRIQRITFYLHQVWNVYMRENLYVGPHESGKERSKDGNENLEGFIKIKH